MKNERLILILLAAVNFTHITDFMIMMPLAPQLTEIFGLTPSQWSLLVSSYAITGGIIVFIATFYLNRWERKKCLMILYTGFLIGSLCCGFSDSYEMLLTFRIFTGSFSGILGAIILSIIGDVCPPERRATGIGIVTSGFAAAASLGVPIGLYFGEVYSWQFPFIAISVISLVILVLLYKYIPTLNEHIEPVDQRKNHLETIQSVTRNKNQLNALGFLGLLILGQFIIIPFISPYMVKNVGLENIELSYIYLVGGLLTVFSAPMVGRLSDKYGSKKVFNFTLFISLIPIVLLTQLGIIPLWQVLIITSMFFIFVSGRTIPANTVILSTASSAERGSFLSLRSFVQQSSSGIASLISGFIMIEHADGTYGNYDIVGYIAAVLSICAFFMIKRIKSKY